MVCPPVQEIIHSLKLVDYLLIQVDKPLYNYYKYIVMDRSVEVSVLCNKVFRYITDLG